MIHTQSRPVFRAIFSLCLCLNLLTACSKKDSDKVDEAQSCLDGATAAMAMSCLDKIAGVQSQSANLVRCSAYFIAQDFSNPGRISKVADALKNSANVANASFAAIGFLAFTKSASLAQNLIDVSTAYNYCVQSQSQGLILMASMAQVATSFSNFNSSLINDCGTNINVTACTSSVKAAACSAVGNSMAQQTQQAAMGTAALTAYNISCINSTQQASTVCQQFQTALIGAGTVDPRSIGSQLASTICSAP